MTELKDTNPKTALGALKPSLRGIPPSALLAMADAFNDGIKKYGLMNWRKDPVTLSTYYDAALRHLLCFWDGEERTSDTKVENLGAVLACCAIILDARAQGTLIDDRPTPGSFSKLCDEFKAAQQATLDAEKADQPKCLSISSGKCGTPDTCKMLGVCRLRGAITPL